MCGYSAYDWKTIAMSRSFGGTDVTSRSPMWIVPSSTGSSPASIRSVVDLPQPDGPTSTRNSPSATSRSRWSTAGCSSRGVRARGAGERDHGHRPECNASAPRPGGCQTRGVVEIRAATEDDWRAMSLADTRAFGYTITAAELERARR